MTIFFALAQNAPMLAAEQERQHLRDWQENKNSQALEALVTSHVRLVFGWAQKLSAEPHVREELVAEGVLGLIRAADLFDLSRDVRFSTYARWWVQNSVRTALARVTSVVDLPTAEAREDSPFRFRAVQFGEESEGLDIVEQVRCDKPTPEEHAIAESSQSEMARHILSALEDLGETEREVVQARNLTAVPETFEALSQRLGVSRERLRQIERRALSRLRNDLMQRGVTSVLAG